MRNVFDTLSYTVSPYSILLIASIFIGFAIAVVLLVRSRVNKNIILFSVMINATLIVYFGLGYTVISNIIYDSKGLGFSSMGGMLGVILGATIVFLVTKDVNILKAYSAMLPIVYAVSKLGCYFVGCCGGIEYNGPFAVKYIGNRDFIMPFYTFPIPLVESICFFVMFAVEILLYKKMEAKYHIVMNMLMCATVKFGLDYLRISHVGQILSMNQIACIVVLIGTCITLFIVNKRSKKKLAKEKRK